MTDLYKITFNNCEFFFLIGTVYFLCNVLGRQRSFMTTRGTQWATKKTKPMSYSYVAVTFLFNTNVRFFELAETADRKTEEIRKQEPCQMVYISSVLMQNLQHQNSSKLPLAVSAPSRLCAKFQRYFYVQSSSRGFNNMQNLSHENLDVKFWREL